MKKITQLIITVFLAVILLHARPFPIHAQVTQWISPKACLFTWQQMVLKISWVNTGGAGTGRDGLQR